MRRRGRQWWCQRRCARPPALARAQRTQTVSTGTARGGVKRRAREHTKSDRRRTRGRRSRTKASRRPVHVARAPASGCARVVAGRIDPSAAQLPLAGALRKEGEPTLELELTHQSPEKKQQRPRHHLGGRRSDQKALLWALHRTNSLRGVLVVDCSAATRLQAIVVWRVRLKTSCLHSHVDAAPVSSRVELHSVASLA